MRCAKTVTVAFSGIMFDGAPFGLNGDVNQSFTLPLFLKESQKLGFCTYEYDSKTTLPYVVVIANLGIQSQNQVIYSYYYSPAPNTLQEAAIFQGKSSSLIVNNLGYPANGGTATITLN